MMNLSHFKPFVDTPFLMEWEPGQTIELQLVEATAYQGVQNRTDRPGRSPFSLLFRGPSTLHVRQGIHRLEHAVLGKLELFLVPVGPDDHGTLLEAVFN